MANEFPCVSFMHQRYHMAEKKGIYDFEIPSSAEWDFGANAFKPDTFIDITN